MPVGFVYAQQIRHECLQLLEIFLHLKSLLGFNFFSGNFVVDGKALPIVVKQL